MQEQAERVSQEAVTAQTVGPRELAAGLIFATPAKTSVFGFIIGTVSGYFGYTTNEGSQRVQRAATNSVVLSSLLIIVVDVILVKVIFFLFPGQESLGAAAPAKPSLSN